MRSRSPIDAAFRDLARTFDALGFPWFLFGAQAAIIYGSTRVTEDIDVTVDLGKHTARELMTALRRKGFELRVADDKRFIEQTRVLPIVHVATSIPVDVVFAGPGLEEMFLKRAQQHQRADISIPVAIAEDLIVMKTLAGRPRDLDDIRSILRAIGTKLDVSLVTDTLKLLEDALAQSDLIPLFTRLRRESSRVAKKKSAKITRSVKKVASRKSTKR